MAMYTNISQRLIHTHDGTMMVPGQAVEVSDEAAGNEGFKDLVESGDIKAGDAPSPEEMEKLRQERADKEQEMLAKAQQPVDTHEPAKEAPKPAQQQAAHPPAQHSTKAS